MRGQKIIIYGIKGLLLFFSMYGSIALADRQSIVNGAMQQLGKTIYYDPSYVAMDYPDGDVPLDRGVCSDVIVRAFRHDHIDLQKLIHRDMKANFNHYPNYWGLKKTDTNIDHRRVPNLEIWFQRHGKSIPITNNVKDYLPGDVVSWRLDNGLPHIGIVGSKITNGHPLIIHNIGQGARLEDVLFNWRIVGHYRYYIAKND